METQEEAKFARCPTPRENAPKVQPSAVREASLASPSPQHPRKSVAMGKTMIVMAPLMKKMPVVLVLRERNKAVEPAM